MEVIDALTFLGETIYWKQPAEELIKRMDKNKIDMAIATPPPPGPDYSEANRRVYEAVKKYPDRIIGFFRVNPHYKEKALAEAETAVKDWGFKGFKMDPTNEAFGLTPRTAEDVMELARKLKVPVYFHTGDSIFCPPVRVEQIARLYPKVTVMMHASTETAVMAMRQMNIVLATGPLGRPMPLDAASERFDTKRLVFSTRAPIGFPELELRIVELSTLDEDTKHRIMSENIKRILKI
ncbi:MAG: amidohydrolase family protein [Candidatus Bathyarchaeota archaeon]|nr:amidohydrolase family protein [Candidatus Bathyarchaeota archaeon]